MKLFALVPASLALLHPAMALAQGAPEDVARLRAELAELKAQDAANRAQIERLEQRLDLLAPPPANSASPVLQPLAAADQAALRGRGTTVAPPLAATAQGATAAEPDRRTPAASDAVEAVARSQQNSYGSRFSIDPGFSYTHFTNAKLNVSGFLALDAIFLGLISIDQVQADILTTDLTARLGLGPRLQFDANVPWIYRRSKFRSGGAGSNAGALSESTVSSSGLGDVSLGASYRLLTESGGRPDVVLNARVKAPTGKDPFGIELVTVPGSGDNLKVPVRLATGTGTWAAAGGVSVLKTIDPMVVFGSVTYYHNFERHFDDLDEAPLAQPGRARLGDAIQYGGGVAYALNDSSSLSLSFSQRFVKGSKVKPDSTGIWQPIVGSDANIAVLNLGATFALSDRAALLFNVSHGITDDAPDMTVSVRLPIRF